MMNNQILTSTSTYQSNHKPSVPGRKTQAAMMEVLRLLRPQTLPETNARYQPGYLRQGADLQLMHRDGRVAMKVRAGVLQGLLDQRLVVHRPGYGYVISRLGIDAVNGWDDHWKSERGRKVLQ